MPLKFQTRIYYYHCINVIYSATVDPSNAILLDADYGTTSDCYTSIPPTIPESVEPGEMTDINGDDPDELPTVPIKRKRQRVKKKRNRRRTNKVTEFIKNSKRWEEVRKMEKIWAKMRANRRYTVYELETNSLPKIVVNPSIADPEMDDNVSEDLRDIFIEMGATSEPFSQEIDTSPVSTKKIPSLTKLWH